MITNNSCWQTIQRYFVTKIDEDTANVDKNLYCTGRSFNFENLLRPYIFSRLGRSTGLLLSSSPQTLRESAGYHIIHAAWPIPIHYSLSRWDIKEMHYLYQDCWPFLLRDSFYCSPFRVTNIGWYVRSTLSIPAFHSAYALHAFAPYTGNCLIYGFNIMVTLRIMIDKRACEPKKQTIVISFYRRKIWEWELLFIGILDAINNNCNFIY